MWSAFQFTGCQKIGRKPQTVNVDSYRKNVDRTSIFPSVFGAYGIPLMYEVGLHTLVLILNSWLLELCCFQMSEFCLERDLKLDMISIQVCINIYILGGHLR